MENKEKNQAINKVETIANKKSSRGKTSNAKKNVASSDKKPVKQAKTEVGIEKGNIISRAEKRLMREKIHAEKQQKLAEIRAQKEKAVAERKRAAIEAREKRKAERIKRRENLAAERLRRKEERIVLKEKLKNETKEERMARIAEEKAAKSQLKLKKAELKAKLASEKRENKRLLKMQKRAAREKRKSESRSRGIGGWLAAVISLGCTVLILGTLFIFNMMYMSNGNEMLNSSYERAYYELVGCVDNIEVALSKLQVAVSPAVQQKLLNDVSVQSELAESQLQTLPLEDSSKYCTSKFINQVGDYSKTLSAKIAEGDTITDENRETLEELMRRNTNLQKALADINGKMGNKFSFLSLLKPEDGNVVIEGFGELENLSVEYPKMIYDGPFSDGLETKTVKGLSGDEITKEKALKVFSALFYDYSVTEAKVLNESNGIIPTYNIEGVAENGVQIYAQLAKQGGKLVMFNCYHDCDQSKFAIENCEKLAELFVEKAGFEGMKPVWRGVSKNIAQFNFAYVVDGVVIYSDLVKVNVCMERGVVSSLEATEYFLNHTERSIGEVKITKEQAAEKVKMIDVISERKAIVPVGGGKEKLAWEVHGKYDGADYYVYIDAVTGEEIEIFRVIESTEGEILL